MKKKHTVMSVPDGSENDFYTDVCTSPIFGELFPPCLPPEGNHIYITQFVQIPSYKNFSLGKRFAKKFNYKMKVVLADGSIGEVEPSKTELEFPTARTVLHTEVNKVILIGEMHNLCLVVNWSSSQ